jgi:hypothetical protein
VGRLVDWPSLFRRNLRSSDLPDRFCLPSIYLVVDVWGSLVMVETNLLNSTSYRGRNVQSYKHVLSCRSFILPLNIPYTVAADLSSSDFVEERDGHGPMKCIRVVAPVTGACLMADHRLLHVSVGIVRSFAGPSDCCPCGVTFCHCPGFRSSHVPGLWRKLVAFACGSTSPDVQVNFPLVTGA